MELVKLFSKIVQVQNMLHDEVVNFYTYNEEPTNFAKFR